MNIDIVATMLIPGGGITTFVMEWIKVMAQHHNIRLIVTHEMESDGKFLSSLYNVKIVNLCVRSKIGCYLSLLKIWINSKPDAVVVNYNAVAQYLLPLLGKRVKKIHIVHGMTDDFIRVASISSSQVDWYVVPSPGCATYVRNNGNTDMRKRLKVVAHGVHTIGYQGCKDIDKLNLIIASTLMPHKGAHLIPELVGELRNRKIDFHLYVAGEGCLKKEIEKRIEHDNNMNYVTFSGLLPRRELHELMGKCHVIVSMSTVESFGLSVAEGMSLGCVPLVYEIKGVSDWMVTNDVDGFVLSEGDIQGLADKIEIFSKNRNIFDRMSKQSRKKIEMEYSINKMIESYEEILR